MGLYDIPVHKTSPEIINCVVEIPRGTSAKYEYDNDLDVFVYDRSLLPTMVYPSNYGFVPRTMTDDGDPLDVLVYNRTPIQRGTLVECRTLGVLDMIDSGDQDYKILAIPVSHIRNYQSLEEVDSFFLKICVNFFQHYKELNGKTVQLLGWKDKAEAFKVIEDSVKQFSA
jgi:inorganic pyrophosphatase